MKENLGVYYGQTSLFQGQQFQKLVSLIKEHAPLDTIKTVLDIGCGNGQRTIEYVDLFPNCKKIIAIDPDPEMISTAKNQYAHPKIEYILLKAENLSALADMNNAFDIVVSNWAVHWIEDKQAMLSHVKNLLKKNGLFFMSTCEKLPEILSDVDTFIRDELKHIKSLINPFHYLKAPQWRALLNEHEYHVICKYKANITHEENNAYHYLKHWFAASTGKFAYSKQIEEFNPLSIDTLLSFIEKKYAHPHKKNTLAFQEDVLFIAARRL